MKFLVVLVLALAAAHALNDPDWSGFKAVHSKVYANQAEEVYRFKIWNMNADFIKRHNADADKGLKTFWVKMNQFGDLTGKEFAAIYNGYNASLRLNTPSPAGVFEYDSTVAVPETVDWRDQGYVTPVKDQGQCGSCWSFSATGSLEGQNFKKSGKLVSLSEQNLVDCSGKYGNMGCNGGLMDQAFTYIKDNKGIDTEQSYPYKAKQGKCEFKESNVGASDVGFTDVKSKDEDALKQAVATVGPISVAIDASHTSFQLYSHGVYHELFCSETRLDHGVLAVGYGTESGSDYWLVKNSWNTVWGDKGYIKMSRNRKNNCGIASQASYPKV